MTRGKLTNMSSHPLQGLYVITNNDTYETLVEKIKLLVTFPCVRLIQYRRKNTPKNLQFNEAKTIHELCLTHGIDFIINDNIELARQLQTFGPCGVHLGQEDGEISDARDILGEHAIIGRTCHQSIELAIEAKQQGANYVAFGAYKKSNSKPSAQTVSSHVIADAKLKVNLPLCLIGGIEPSDFAEIKQLNVEMIAVINGALSGDLIQVKQKMSTWQSLFDSNT